MGLRLHGRLTQVRAASEDDADLLVEWHADPDVSSYWDDETFTRDGNARAAAAAGRRRLHRRGGGEPIGYVQAWWEEDEPRRGGIDMFLVPSARGRGLGPDAARTLTESLLASGWTRVTVDPYSWNEPAIRAWRRAGFVEVDRRPADDEHTSAWTLMEFQSASGSS